MMTAVKMVNQMEQDQDRSFLKVALSSSLLFFMCLFGLFFDVVDGVYNFPFYDMKCDCFMMYPKNSFSINVQWVIKDLSIFIYSIVVCLISIINADFKMWGFNLMWMWLLFLVMLPLDYLLSYETNPFRIYIESFLMIVQIIYTAEYAKKYM